jgi:hypothetical protein
MKKELDVKFYSKVQLTEKPVSKSVASGRKFENHIRISKLEELRPVVFSYLRASYDMFA